MLKMQYLMMRYHGSHHNGKQESECKHFFLYGWTVVDLYGIW